MWKKIGLWSLGLLVVLVGILCSPRVAFADELPQDAIQGLDKPSEIYLITDPNASDLGQKVDTDDTLNYQFKLGQNYHLVYNWTVKPGTDISAGKTVTFSLPANIANTPLRFDLYRDNNSGGNKIGKFYKAEDATTATITFTDELKGDKSFSNGQLIIPTSGTATDTETGTGSGGPTAVISKGGWYKGASGNNSNWVMNGNTFYPKTASWDAFFNEDTKDMGDVTLVDDLGQYLTFEPETFYVTNETTDQQVPATDYTISQPDSSSEIIIVFKHVTGKIHLQYETKVDYNQMIADGLQGGYLSNSIRLSAEDGESGGAGSVPGSGSDAGNPQVTGDAHKDQLWGASGIGTLNGEDFLGSVIFTKESAANPTLGLAGAIYNLQRKDGSGTFEDVQKNVSTDAMGEIKNSSLPTGTYRYQEVQAPTGYQINVGQNAYSPEFTIAESDNVAQPHLISQTDKPFKVTLIKTAKETAKTLAGATYRLYYADTKKLASNITYKTAANGQLAISPIAKGSYDFIEQTPPAGYKLDQTPIPFTISDNQPIASVSQADESSIPTPGTDTGNGSSSSSSSSNTSSSSSSSSSSPSSSSSTSTSTSTRTSTSTLTSSSNSESSSSRHGNRVGSTTVPRVSSSTHGGGASTITGNQATSAKHHAQANAFLPKTNEAKSIFAALGGFLLIGGSLSVWQYRRTRQN